MPLLGIPNIVRHSYNEDPKPDPKLEKCERHHTKHGEETYRLLFHFGSLNPKPKPLSLRNKVPPRKHDVKHGTPELGLRNPAL